MMSHKVLCTFALLVACAFALEKCGDNLFYNLVGNVLTINGTGAMDDYSDKKLAPWAGDEIVTVDIKEGATTIGKFAFYNLTNLTTAYIPQSVVEIKKSAFDSCTALTDANLPDHLKVMESKAFYGTNIPSIVIPETLETLGLGTFSFSGLMNVIYMGNKTFEGNSIDLCTGCYKFKSLCLNPDYNNTRFAECCNGTITEDHCYHPINGANCKTFLGFYSICNKAEYKAGSVNKVQREETIAWEKKTAESICYSYTCDDKKGFVEQMSNIASGWIAKGKTDHCMQYACINGTGNVRWSSCNTTATQSRLCIDTCVTNWEPTLKYWVDIVLKNDTSYMGDSLDDRMVIANLGGVKHGEISVYYKMDDNENCLSIIVKTKNEASAELIKKGVETLKDDNTCHYGILCKWSEVIVHTPPKASSSSSARAASNGSVSIHGLSAIMTFFLLLVAIFMN